MICKWVHRRVYPVLRMVDSAGRGSVLCMMDLTLKGFEMDWPIVKKRLEGAVGRGGRVKRGAGTLSCMK